MITSNFLEQVTADELPRELTIERAAMVLGTNFQASIAGADIKEPTDCETVSSAFVEKTLDDKTKAFMTSQAHTKKWHPTTIERIPEMVARTQAHKTPLLCCIEQSLAAEIPIKLDILRDCNSLNQLAASGDPLLRTLGGIYLGVGVKADQIGFFYIGRGKSFLDRVILAHLPCIQYGVHASTLHYKMASTCDEMLYFALMEWYSPGDAEAGSIAIAEWYACTLLGTYQTSSEYNHKRSAFGLPRVTSKGANAKDCMEIPRVANAANAVDKDEGCSMGEAQYNTHMWTYMRLTQMYQLHLALVATGRDLGPSPWLADLMRGKQTVRNHMVRRLLAGEFKTRIRSSHGTQAVQVLGFSVPTAAVDALEGQVGDEIAVRVRFGNPDAERDICPMGSIERAELQGIRVQLSRGPRKSFVQVLAFPVPKYAVKFLDLIWDCLPKSEHRRRGGEVARATRVQLTRAMEPELLMSDSAQQLWLGRAALTSGTLMLHFGTNAVKLAATSAQSFPEKRRAFLSAMGFEQEWTHKGGPQFPVRMEIMPGAGSFEASRFGSLTTLPPGANAWQLAVYCAKRNAWEPLPFKVSCGAGMDGVFDAFRELMHAQAPHLSLEEAIQLLDPASLEASAAAPIWLRPFTAKVEQNPSTNGTINFAVSTPTVEPRIRCKFGVPAAEMRTLFPDPGTNLRAEVDVGIWGCQSFADMHMRWRVPGGEWREFGATYAKSKVWDWYVNQRAKREFGDESMVNVDALELVKMKRPANAGCFPSGGS